MDSKSIHNINKNYWDTNADEWFGVTALPTYGVKFVTEDELKLFGDVSGKKLLDIGCGYTPKLINSPMEIECGIPKDYFDFVYSIYAIGWTTDLQGTFNRIASYLKKGGIFIFSWKHPLHHCVTVEEDKLVFKNSYFDEHWFTNQLDGGAITLCNRKISTYINALARAGFIIEQMIEETDKETMASTPNDDKSKKAKMLPLSFIFKARKL